LTFGYLKRRTAPLKDLAQPLGISKQALDQRLEKPSAPDFFKRVLLVDVKHEVPLAYCVSDTKAGDNERVAPADRAGES
jgi:hypothetical protein